MRRKPYKAYTREIKLGAIRLGWRYATNLKPATAKW